MIVALDIDSVLGDFGKHFLDYLNIEDKTPPTKWTDSRFSDNFHLIEEDWRFWLTIPILTKPCDIDFKVDYYCTARPIPSWVTEVWLAKHGFPKAPVLTVGHDGSKVDVLLDVGVEVMLDDAIHNYKDLMKGGIQCFLFTRRHNTHYETPFRVESLIEFGNILKHLETVKSTII